MVAVIKTSTSLRNVLHYNENKLRQKVARLIHSHGFGKDTDNLSFTDKLRTFEKLQSLNERTQLKTVHISLNFDPSEKLDADILANIADNYMQKIGFGSQPYLVYEHQDAGHPHIHLVTTCIQRDSNRIRMQNIGRNQSEKARKEIEQEFHLKPAERPQKQVHELKPVPFGKVQYGKTETKRAITNVLNHVLPVYKYASLPELNAVLRQYNIMADRGSEDSKIYKSGGLVYRVLNEKGEKMGTPVKASAIYSRPTLKFLQELFHQNAIEKQPHKQRLKNVIDFTLATRSRQSIREFTAALAKEKIQTVLRQNEQGIIYGITYVDHQTKCVFNGSDLGKQYSAHGIQQRCNKELKPAIESTLNQKHKPVLTGEWPNEAEIRHNNSFIMDMAKALTQPQQEIPLAAEFRQEQIKKRKRKRLHH